MGHHVSAGGWPDQMQVGLGDLMFPTRLILPEPTIGDRKFSKNHSSPSLMVSLLEGNRLVPGEWWRELTKMSTDHWWGVCRKE